MKFDKVRDPNGGRHKVEALTIGLLPALSLVATAIATTVLVVGMFVALQYKIDRLNEIVLITATDRWTRSNMESLCGQLELINKEFHCPDTLPKTTDPFSARGRQRHLP